MLIVAAFAATLAVYTMTAALASVAVDAGVYELDTSVFVDVLVAAAKGCALPCQLYCARVLGQWYGWLARTVSAVETSRASFYISLMAAAARS